MVKETNKYTMLIICGCIGIIAVLLVLCGNPKNMGFCVACFIRDTAGALGMHNGHLVSYIRPEIIGLVLGSLLMSFYSKEFRPRGGSSPMTRLVMGFFVMVGALMFLGCPLRMILRLAGGDLNALVGLVGVGAGIWAGAVFLNMGFSLKRTYALYTTEGLLFPVVNVVLLLLMIFMPALILFSESGPGSMHAPLFISLAAGLLVGVLAQKSRLCFAGGIRDVILFRDWSLLMSCAVVFIAALIGNLTLNTIFSQYFTFGFVGQPIAHTDGIWNFLGMALVGLGSVLLGGCPMRQIVLAGEGNTDSVMTVVGFVLGASVSHNFGLTSSATTITNGIVFGGPTLYGKVATVTGIFVILIIAIWNTVKAKNTIKGGVGI